MMKQREPEGTTLVQSEPVGNRWKLELDRPIPMRRKDSPMQNFDCAGRPFPRTR
jgi:hypothetical protein